MQQTRRASCRIQLVERLNKQNVPTIRIDELDQGGGDIRVDAFASPKDQANAEAGATLMPNTAVSNLAADAREGCTGCSQLPQQDQQLLSHFQHCQCKDISKKTCNVNLVCVARQLQLANPTSSRQQI